MPATITIDPILEYGQSSKFKTSIESINSNSYFVWGKSGFLDKEFWSTKAIVPSYYDASTEGLDYSYWASGHAHNPIVYKGIDWQKSNSKILSPAFNSGYIYSFKQELPLISDDAVRIVPQNNSAISLSLNPKVGSLFNISSFKYSDTNQVEVYKNYRVLNAFDSGDNYQAKVEIEDIQWITEPIDSVTGGPLYTITISEATDINSEPVFEQNFIFQTRVTSTPNENGEWKFTSSTSIQVYWNDSSVVSYWGRLKFKKAVIGTITPKSTWGETGTANIGVSNGEVNQYFNAPYFPLHTVTVRVNGVAWTKVSDITAAGNYVGVDEDLGIIWFGNGTQGNIPSTGSQISCSYTIVPLITYEPSYSKTYVTGNGVDVLDQSILSEGRGFIIASPQTAERRLLDASSGRVVASISLSVDAGTDVNTPLLCTVRALDSLSRPVKNALIKLNVGSPNSGNQVATLRTGKFSEPVVQTNSNGYAYTYFIPSKNLWDYTVCINLYGRGGGENPTGTRGTVLTGTYQILNGGFRINNTSEAWQDANILFDSINPALRMFVVEDNDKWTPFNYESRTGGRKGRLYLPSTHQTVNVTTVFKSVTFITVIATSTQAALSAASPVQVHVAPVKTIIWATLVNNTAIFSSSTSRNFDIINQSGIDGNTIVNTHRVLQAGWLNPQGSIWP